MFYECFPNPPGLAVLRAEAPPTGERAHRAIEVTGGVLEKGLLHVDLSWRLFRPFTATSMLFNESADETTIVNGVLFVHLFQVGRMFPECGLKLYSASTLVLFLSVSCSWDGGSRASAQLSLNVDRRFTECGANVP